jgi:glycosyltransferase involved in cell wall biosynthesis
MLAISICIIGKNEEKNIETCLSSIPKDSFEIIYVDTGSTDSTIDIAKKFTSNIYHFDWINDFSAARNFSISKATNDWILVLDCDESITYIDTNKIKTLIQKYPNSVGLLYRNNITNKKDGNNQSFDFVKRLFNRKYFKYTGSIHEQVTSFTSKYDIDTFSFPLEIVHTGYTGSKEELLEKAKRNIDLISKELEKTPDSPYHLFQMGQSFYFIEDYENAVSYFSKALQYDVDPKNEYVKLLIVSYGYALSYTNHIQDAIIICEEVHSYFDEYADFMFLCGYLYMKNGPWEKAVEHFKKSAILKDASSNIAEPAYFNLGCIYEVLGQKEAALEYFLKAPDFNDSKEHIKHLQI